PVQSGRLMERISLSVRFATARGLFFKNSPTEPAQRIYCSNPISIPRRCHGHMTAKSWFSAWCRVELPRGTNGSFLWQTKRRCLFYTSPPTSCELRFRRMGNGSLMIPTKPGDQKSTLGRFLPSKASGRYPRMVVWLHGGEEMVENSFI